MVFSPDGKTIATGYDDSFGNGAVVMYEVARRQRMADKPLAAENYAGSVAFSPDGKILAAGGYGGWRWDVPRRERLVQFHRVAAEGSSPSPPPTPPIPQPSAEKLLASAEGPPLPPPTPAVTRRTDGLQAGIERRGYVMPTNIKLFDDKLSAPTKDDVQSLAFSPDGKTLAVGYSNFGVGLWDVTRREQLPVKLHAARSNVTSVAFSPDGKTLAAAYRMIQAQGVFEYSRSGVELWDVASWERLTKDRQTRWWKRDERDLQPRRRDPRCRIPP